jgi:N-acetylmuramoyl-L-alanine amidase
MALTILQIRRLRFVLGLCSVLWAAQSSAAAPVRVQLSDRAAVALTEERDIFLEALPKVGEGLLGFSRRLCGTSEFAEEIADANRGVGYLQVGVRYRVPFALLLPDHQREVVRALFKSDYTAANGWYHQVSPVAQNGRESLWHVALWFTGRGDNYREIRDSNHLADDELTPGQEILIPARLLRPAGRSALPPESPYYVEYAHDRKGEYAVYRLKPGEALYSSVVIRFTGRVYADDVNALAEEIAERSGIRNVKEIPVGYPVKIPFEILLPEFLPATDPRRREYEAGLIASSQFTNPVTAARLAGITVILDAGHGGSDAGATVGSVWESVYVYDIMVRVKRLLEETTAAVVVSTIRDGDAFQAPDRDVLPRSRGHKILTNPVYPIKDSTVALHLRWYLANSLFRQALARGSDPSEVIFVSIHADSLHRSLRGSMVYIPGARYRRGTFGKSGAAYAARHEVREKPEVSFSQHDRVRSEGLSRELARYLLRSFAADGLMVHPDKPIREKIIRKRREWVPAVLRYNAVPAQLLLEVCNLASDEDRRLIQTRGFRQQVAESITKGIVEYYGDSKRPAEVQVAAAGR